jgi:hypothetical protein
MRRGYLIIEFTKLANKGKGIHQGIDAISVQGDAQGIEATPPSASGEGMPRTL